MILTDNETKVDLLNNEAIATTIRGGPTCLDRFLSKVSEVLPVKPPVSVAAI